ncbi:MAG TPA: 4'-phosphopantetheinyl transferase superfamily protein [Candidatus Saccharimonadales bacterium]|jgi:4'-phosphopantetheinyl transferase|nr:4'-phosphopantetheinyl transferase superfamily protein [Candidatus Saccharimonadales bacterium]
MFDGATQWNASGPFKDLVDGEVHVWRGRLEQPEAVLESCRAILPDDELARAARFYFEKHRRHFMIAHGMLRQVLAPYLGMAPREIRFRTEKNGKPELAENSRRPSLRFNLSHSGELALLAVTEGQIVGVDVELHRADFAGEDIARRFFSEQEASKLCALPAEQKVEAFFNCWTRKEAYVKAIGEGLSLPLDSFDLTFAPGEPPALLRVAGHPEELLRWSLYNLTPGEGYAGALLVEGRQHVLHCREWTGQD